MFIIPFLLKRDDNDDNSTQRNTLISLIVVLITLLLFVVFFYSSFVFACSCFKYVRKEQLNRCKRTNEWFKNTRALREHKTITHTRYYKSMTTQWEKEMELFSPGYLRFSPPPDERDPERSQISVYRYVRLLDADFHLVHRSELA